MRRLAVVPGSFDPPTLGHLDVIERAAQLFDQIVVAVGANSSKVPLLTSDERLSALRDSVSHLENVSVDQFDGLLIEFVKKIGARSIVRGLRATADFEYEFQIAMVNRRLDSHIETVFLMTSWEHSFLSSSIVREVATLGGRFEGFVHPAVVPIVERALVRRKRD